MMTFDNVTFSFRDKVILDGFSFTFPDRGVTCFSGPSGCGKTTLFRLIAGLIKPQSGKIVSDYKRVAFMFQEDRLLPWLTVRKNVEAVMPPGDPSAALKWLRAVGLESESDALPSSLSGGMRRRVALARALAYGGDLLLLDEPFKGLDSELIEELACLIKGSGVPSFVIAHSEREIELLGGSMILFGGPPLKIVKSK